MCVTGSWAADTGARQSCNATSLLLTPRPAPINTGHRVWGQHQRHALVRCRWGTPTLGLGPLPANKHGMRGGLWLLHPKKHPDKTVLPTWQDRVAAPKETSWQDRAAILTWPCRSTQTYMEVGPKLRPAGSKTLDLRLKVSRLYPPNEGSLAGCEPPVRFEPRTHKLRGRTADFPLQVPRRLLKCLEQQASSPPGAHCTFLRKN